MDFGDLNKLGEHRRKEIMKFLESPENKKVRNMILRDDKVDEEEYECYLEEILRITDEEGGGPVYVIDFFKAFKAVLESMKKI